MWTRFNIGLSLCLCLEMKSKSAPVSEEEPDLNPTQTLASWHLKKCLKNALNLKMSRQSGTSITTVHTDVTGSSSGTSKLPLQQDFFQL